METQSPVPLDSVIWAVVIAAAVWFFSAEQRKKHGNLISALVGGMIAVGYIFLMVLFDSEIIKHLRISNLDEKIIAFLGWIAGGLFAVFGLNLLRERTDAQSTMATAQLKTITFTEQRYIDDRYDAAIKLLGHEHSRITAYRALYKLANDYEKLRKIIFDTLCDHLRQITNEPAYRAAHKAQPSEGVQTLLDLLFSIWGKRIFREFDANLQRVYLVGAHLSSAHLRHADFTDANLQYVKFEGVYLRGANLTRAKMHAAILNSVQMQNADMSQTILQFATINCSEMQCAYLSCTDFRGACLLGTDMECSSWHSVDFRGARLEFVRMLQCDLQRGHFGGSVGIDYPPDSFESCILERAERNGDLEECIVRGDMDRKQVERIANSIAEISETNAEKFRAKMKEHIGILEERLTAEECKRRNIDLRAYTEEEAAEWIAEYKEATGET